MNFEKKCEFWKICDFWKKCEFWKICEFWKNVNYEKYVNLKKCEFWKNVNFEKNANFKKNIPMSYVDICWRMIDERKHNQNDHDSRCDELPANFPIPMEKGSQIHVHFLDIVQKSIRSINPSHKDDFQESHQKQIPWGTFVVNQGKHVVTSTSAHTQSGEKSKYANRNHNVFWNRK